MAILIKDGHVSWYQVLENYVHDVRSRQISTKKPHNSNKTINYFGSHMWEKTDFDN